MARSTLRFLKHGWGDFSKAEGLALRPVTTGLIRKSMVTMWYAKTTDPGERHKLAVHLDHSTQTAER